MKRHSVVLLVAVFLMIDWSGSMGHAFVPATASIGLPQKAVQTQTYEPTSRGTPGRREGGSTR